MGYYKCPRCGGTDTYKSQETTSYAAMTIDVPGPVDNTLINPNKREITRCRVCDAEAFYTMSNVEAERAKRIFRPILIALPFVLVGIFIFIVNFL
jgi:predicted nucleic-acid-binding Zn-ribbon protein